MREGGFCAILIQTARKSLILNGEMSEWLKEHAWKAKRASKHQAISKHPNAYAISDLTFQNDHSVCVRKPRCSSRF